jgi:hypothetical protein
LDQDLEILKNTKNKWRTSGEIKTKLALKLKELFFGTFYLSIYILSLLQTLSYIGKRKHSKKPKKSGTLNYIVQNKWKGVTKVHKVGCHW